MVLELVNIRVHTVSRCRSHRTARIALRSLCRSGIEDRMILEILRHFLAGIQTSLQFGMSDVASHDDSTFQINAGAYRIFGEFLAHSINTFVEVNLNALCSLARLAQFLRDKFRRIRVHLLNPNTVGIDLALDIAVGRTAHAHTDRTACTVARQTNHADVVSQILTTELCTESNLVSLVEELVLQVDVAERATGLVACSRQRVVIFYRSELHGEQVLLSRRAADNESNMIRRTSGSTQRLHLLNEERQQSALVLDSSLCHRIEVSLVCRTSTLGNTNKAILVALGSLDVNLSRQVATCVHLVVHIQRSILRVAQIVLSVSIVNTERESFLVLEISPDALSLLSVDNSGTGVLTERQDTFCSSLGIAQELQSYILVVLRSLRVRENLSHLQVVLAT